MLANVLCHVDVYFLKYRSQYSGYDILLLNTNVFNYEIPKPLEFCVFFLFFFLQFLEFLMSLDTENNLKMQWIFSANNFSLSVSAETEKLWKLIFFFNKGWEFLSFSVPSSPISRPSTSFWMSVPKLYPSLYLDFMQEKIGAIIEPWSHTFIKHLHLEALGGKVCEL